MISIYVSGQDFRTNSSRSLFSDYKACRVGDAITILVVESSQASNQAATNTGRSDDLGLNLQVQQNSIANPDLKFQTGTSSAFKGSGSTSSQGMVQTKISATIDSVLANGNLRVKGSRKITINGEDQNVQIKGIVRPSDISSDNSVLSYNISEAEISFKGEGLIAKNQHPGWITKFLHWLF